MAKLKVGWTHFVKYQRDEIFEYWNNRNKNTSYSKKLKTAIKIKTEQLKIYPFMGKKTLKDKTRILTLKNYSLIYIVDKKIIYIISFWENHQNPEKLTNILGL